MEHASDADLGGVPMICATGALKTGPTRIGHIAGNVTLPRTVALPTLVAVGAGALLGIFLAMFVPVGGVQKWVFGPAFGGMAGWFLTTFSPLRDESLLTWLGLQLNTMRRQRMVDGEPVLVAVGSGVVGREVLGKMTITRSALRISPDAWDDRGVQIAAANHNLDQSPSRVSGAALAGGGAAAPSVDLQVPIGLQQGPARRRTMPATGPVTGAPVAPVSPAAVDRPNPFAAPPAADTHPRPGGQHA